MRPLIPVLALALLFATTGLSSQQTVIVRPNGIDEVLVNPGMGIIPFHRIANDRPGAAIRRNRGVPIDHQGADGADDSSTTLECWRIYWRYLHPAPDSIAWDLVDLVLDEAASRGHTVNLRIGPYNQVEDVPDWYRALVGEEPNLLNERWRTDPNNPLYLQHFGGLIRRLGVRYDGHPALESVDISIVGWWGEGEGSHQIEPAIWRQLNYCYLDAFKKTFLLWQPLNSDTPDPAVLSRDLPIAVSWPDGSNNGAGSQLRHLGFRADCLGDLGFWRAEQGDWCHMLDAYPQQIILSGMQEAWKKAPVSWEICSFFPQWRSRYQYDERQVQYIIDQALKWHISSVNLHNSPIPDQWRPLMDEWLKRMGYRLVLRKFTFPDTGRPNGRIAFASWWENQGVAPCYHRFPLALRLKNAGRSEIFLTDADIRTWLPGDAVYDSAVFLPPDLPAGSYELDLAILDPQTRRPNVRLAIEGRGEDGWYHLGRIEVQP